MQSHTRLQALRIAAVSLVSLTACTLSMAAEPVLLAKATSAATSQVRPVVTSQRASLAEAYLIAMRDDDFNIVLTQALSTPTATGFPVSARRAAAEEGLARTVAVPKP
jgi:hypothetical protein